MNKKITSLFILFGFIFLGLTFSVQAKLKLEKIKKFIPKNHKVLEHIEADLNNDKNPDLVIVLANKNEDTVQEQIPRILLILLQKSDKNYELVLKNNTIILCQDCGGVRGDPMIYGEGLKIDKGYLQIKQAGGSPSHQWYYTVDLKYMNKQWVITKYNSFFVERLHEKNLQKETLEMHDYLKKKYLKQVLHEENKTMKSKIVEEKKIKKPSYAPISIEKFKY